jgi:uncharacterized protein YjbJ (UPF0337 family)
MIDKSRITGALDEFGGKVQSEIGDLAGSSEDSLAGRARTVQGRAKSMVGLAKDAARDAADDASEFAADAYEKTERQLAATGRDVAVRITDHPLSAVLVAGLVGFGLGYLARGRD